MIKFTKILITLFAAAYTVSPCDLAAGIWDDAAVIIVSLVLIRGLHERC